MLLLYFLLAVAPSFGFLWAILVEAFYLFRTSKLDKQFNSIVKDVEEELEEKEEDGEAVSVAFLEDKAYWVLDNTFYEADIIDGVIDKTTSRPVDAYEMTNLEIMKMLFILDNLTEGQ
jgi:hypothetical protein